MADTILMNYGVETDGTLEAVIGYFCVIYMSASEAAAKRWLQIILFMCWYYLATVLLFIIPNHNHR